MTSSDTVLLEQQRRCASMLEELKGVAHAMLARMHAEGGENTGLFCHKLRLNERGELERRGVSVTYTAMAWIGLCSAGGAQALATPEGSAFVIHVQRLLAHRPETLSLGDLGLLLWIDAWAGSFGRDVLDLLTRRFEREKAHAGTMHLAWVLTGLMRGVNSLRPCDRVLVEDLVRLLLAAYRPGSGYFTLNPYQIPPWRWRNRYKNRLGSFATQVYPLMALSFYIRRFPNGAIEQVIRDSVEAVCRSQGDRGEWWWIYDTENGEVYIDYPVYSVHQDAMGPMALLATQAACGSAHWSAIEKSLNVIFDSGAEAGALYDRKRQIIWRAVVKNVTGEDAADLSFGLPTQDLSYMHRIHWPLLRGEPAAPAAYRLLQEARPYCAGWILLTATMARDAAGSGTSYEQLKGERPQNH